MDLVEEEEAAVTAAVIIIEAIAAAATAAVPLDLIAHTIINLLEQKVGKTEVMEILLKTLNMKVAEAEEKEVLPMTVMLLARIISNPFLQVQKSI